MHKRRTLTAAAIATVGWIGSAQAFPDKIIELMVPSPPGASADIVGRVLVEGMAAHLGGRFVVQNKGGAGGVLGTIDVARAKPDGYTLLHGAAVSVTVAPLTDRATTPYSRQSFDGICQTFKNDQAIVARPGTYKNVAELITATKAKPGGLNYGTPGVGTIPHLAIAEVSQIAKVEFNVVPFRGPAETIQMTHGGQLDFAVSPLTAAANSNLHMPGLFAEKRNPSIPDVPTVIEQGYNVAPLSIGGLFAPVGLPPDVKKKLADACMAAMKTEAFIRMAKNTLQPVDFMADSEQFSKNLDKDVEDKRRLLTALGMVKN
jgi:tripartite-type tricarboxylate transporter receptor subunit TctC